MKLIIITAAAPPEPIVAGRVHWDIADHLADNNNEVLLISPYPSRPLSIKYPIHKSNSVTKVKDNFYHVNINSFRYPRYNLFFRACESLDFGIKSIRYVNRKIKSYDLIYASPWAYLGQLMIVILRKDKRKPLIMNVQDLYPESFITKMNSRIIYKLSKPLFLLDKYIANCSSHITVVSESLKQVYLNSRKTNDSKVSVISNWQDESEFVKPVIPKKQIFEKYNLKALDKRFVYMYLGNIGPVAGVEIIINAFAKLHINDSTLVIAGCGSYKERCRLLADKLKISNIFFLEVPPGLQSVVELQSISDVLLLPIMPDAANSSIPSKLIAYMFSGKPIITSANIQSETASAIKESGCGWITKSNDISEWTKLMNLAIKTNKTKLNAMGRSGFGYALKNYSKKEGLIKVSQLFYKLIN